MNGSRSPEVDAASSTTAAATITDKAGPNGHRRLSSHDHSRKSPSLGPQAGNAQHVNHTADHNSPPTAKREHVNGHGDDGESEAETLISSPVKKREMEKQKQQVDVKTEPLESTKVPDLPAPSEGSPIPEDVPTPGQDLDEHDGDMSVDNEESELIEHTKNGKLHNDKDGDSNSDSLSEVSSRSPSHPGSSRSSSRSRAASERPGLIRNGTDSPNPRKRKHRASSVGLPNKRQSTDNPGRKIRHLTSEDHGTRSSADGSLSPRLRSHRRAVSTQSASVDGVDHKIGRKRRNAPQYPVREPRSAKGWEESDASSEATSHGQLEQRRPTRGIGRATSTPGRGPGREHKRYVSKYGFTRMAEACESGDLDAVKYWREKDPEQLELPEFAGNTPLQIASLNGNADIVEYLIKEGVRIDISNGERDTPLIDAAENGHLDTVDALLKAGVDPLRTNKVGQAALDVVHDDTDNADEIRAALREAIKIWNSDGAKQRREEEEARFGAGPSKGLHFMARTYENLLKLVQDNDRNGVREFLDARVPVDNAIVAAAAKTGDLYLVNMLLAEITEKKKWQKPEKPMLAVLGTSHYEMVKSLTMLEQFNASYANRQGKTWPEIAEDRAGPNWKQEMELLQDLYDEKNRQAARRSSSPVTKRDTVKRPNKRKIPDDDSDEDDVPAKPKNGRRLLSRRAMIEHKRAENDSHGDDTDTDAPGSPDLAEEHRKKPIPTQTSPGAKRGPGRPPSRPRSASNPNQDAKLSPKMRRRSNSVRDEQTLPSVEETDEVMRDGINRDDEAKVEHAAREEDAKPKAEENQLLEAKRKKEEEEAEAKRKEAEAEAKAKADAEAEAEAKRIEEEVKRKAEEERRAEELRKVEEAKENARKQQQLMEEKARQAEENRRKEAEFAEAKASFRRRLIDSLPSTISQVFDPDSRFPYATAEARDYVKRHLLPLQAIIRLENGKRGLVRNALEMDAHVLNLQAAPLLGEHGWELLIPDTSPFAVGTLRKKWHSLPCTSEESASLVQRMHPDQLCPASDEDDLDGLIGYNIQLSRIAERAQAWKQARRQILNNEMIELRWVKLKDVLESSSKAANSAGIDIVLDWQKALTSSLSPSSSPPTFNGFSKPGYHHELKYYTAHGGKLRSSMTCDDDNDDVLGPIQIEATLVHEK